MLMMYTQKSAFEEVKKFLEVNKYDFDFYCYSGQYFLKIY
jgi:hypothetical protein